MTNGGSSNDMSHNTLNEEHIGGLRAKKRRKSKGDSVISRACQFRDLLEAEPVSFLNKRVSYKSFKKDPIHY